MIGSSVALIIGIAIGAVSTEQEVENLEAEVADLKDDVEEAEDEARDAADELASREQALSERESSLREKEADQRRAAAEQRRELAAREEEVSAAERAKDANTITEGIWQLGRDYEAGLYRAPGGGGCYWAKLSSGSTSDIIENGGFSKNQTLQIDSPFFETSDCGDWVKIG